MRSLQLNLSELFVNRGRQRQNAQLRYLFCLVVGSQLGLSDDVLLTQGDKPTDLILSKLPNLLDLGGLARAARLLY
jgi:hypothetical protein